MSIDQINIAPEPSVEAPKATRRENLALGYQEILTVTTRLRASRQAVMDAETFRSSMKAALSAAEADAVRKGYALLCGLARLRIAASPSAIRPGTIASGSPFFLVTTSP